jgi:hypothetical protein
VRELRESDADREAGWELIAQRSFQLHVAE